MHNTAWGSHLASSIPEDINMPKVLMKIKLHWKILNHSQFNSNSQSYNFPIKENIPLDLKCAFLNI